MMSGSPRGGRNPESANVVTQDDQLTHGDARLRTFAIIPSRAVAESLWGPGRASLTCYTPSKPLAVIDLR